MKKTVSLLLIALLLLGSLAGCGTDSVQEQTTAPTTAPTEPTDTTGGDIPVPTDPQVGNVLLEPEKTVSLGDLQSLTVTLQTQSSYEIARRITYAVDTQGERITFYERNTEKDFLATDFYGYESVCVADGDAVSLFANTSASGTGFTPVDYSAEYGTNDGYFRNQLAYLGVDYSDWITTDGFTKCEDTVFMDTECYVYTFAFTDWLGQGYKGKICVDKQTGLWLSFHREIPGTEDVFTAEVLSVTGNAEVIPGARFVTMPTQGIYEQDGISVTATALDFSDPNHAVLRLETTNTSAADVRLSSHYVTVNGLCVGGNMMSHVCPAGQTVQSAVELSNRILEQSGIQAVKEIGFAFWIDEIHMEDGEEIYDGTLVENTGDLKVLTDCGDYVQNTQPEGQVLLDNQNVKLVLESLRLEDNGGAWLIAYCQNGWSEPVHAELSLAFVNGTPCAYSDRITMQEGLAGYAGFRIPRSVLTELGIDSIESVALTYEVFLGDSVMSDECIVEKSQVISVDFEN